jgi:hypothetical protein
VTEEQIWFRIEYVNVNALKDAAFMHFLRMRMNERTKEDSGAVDIEVLEETIQELAVDPDDPTAVECAKTMRMLRRDYKIKLPSTSRP